MMRQSLPFVSILVISFIAIGSNLVVITSDIKNENAVRGHGKSKEILHSSNSLIRKRDTFDENGNFDLYYKASTKESKVWFKFTSPTPAYHQHESIDDNSRKDIKSKEQVQGLTNDTAHYIYENVDDYPIQYIGCFSTWEKQYTHLQVPVSTDKYDDSQRHITCAIKCRQRGAQLQISFLKGAECHCAPIYDFNSELKPRSYCDIPCPVKDYLPSSRHIVPNYPCGGNQGYSVYCTTTGPEDCTSVVNEAKGRLAAVEAQHHALLLSENKPKPKPVLEQHCVTCDSSIDGKHDCARPYRFPDFDYFPTNSPEKCVEYCGSTVPYVIVGSQEKERPPTQYALLMWAKDDNSAYSMPICRCVNDGIRNLFTEVEDTSECNMRCPGKWDAICGGKDRDKVLFATVYCVDNGANGNCGKTTTNTPGGGSQDPCSDEDIDCDGGGSSESTTTEGASLPTEETETTPSTTHETTTTEPTTITTNKTTTTEATTTETTTISTNSTSVSTTTSSTTTSTPTSSTPISASTTSRWPTIPSITPRCSTRCQEWDRNGYYWEVCAGEQAIVPCAELNKNSHARGLAFWTCSMKGHFETPNPNVSNCTSVWLEEEHEEIDNIKNVEDADAFVNRLAEACRDAKNPNSTSRYYGHEIRDITSLVELIVAKARDYLNESTFSDLESVVDKAVDLNTFLIQYSDPWKDLPLPDKSAISTDIIDSTEDALFHLTHEARDRNYKRSFADNSTDSNKFLILAETIDKATNAQNRSYEFPPKSERGEQTSFIKLPPGWGKLASNKQIEIAAMSIDSEFISNIMPGQYENLVSSSNLDEDTSNTKLINGRLMSFTLKPAETHQAKLSQDTSSVSTQPTILFTGKGVEITFHHDIEAWGSDIQNIPRSLHDGELPKAVLGSSKCVYWDTKSHTWSSKGCIIVKSNRYETVCECNHLTSFAILMDLHNYVGKQFGLELLTLILCPASEVALVVSIIILSSVSGLQKIRATITKNLSACLLVGNGLVLFVLDRNYLDMDEGVCMGAAMVTHYIFLCAFMWMLIEGVQLYRMVVHVFDSGRSYIKHFGIFAYGSPLIVIAITATTGYLRGDKPYGGDVYCWLQGSYIWSFMGPVALITMVNLIILFIALKTAYQVQQNKKSSPVFIMGKIRSYKTWFKGCFSLTVILGLTWIVGFFMMMKSPGGIVAAYIFTVLNASQGLFIFFFNVVFNEKVRSFTQRNLSTYLPSWLSSSSGSNPGGTDGSIYGKRPLSSMKSGDSVLPEKAKKRNSARRQISNSIKVKGHNKIFTENITNDPVPSRLPRVTKVDFAEARNVFISSDVPHHPKRYESTGTISSLDSIPTSTMSDSGQISSDNSQNVLISKVRF